jgi:ribonuclease T2
MFAVEVVMKARVLLIVTLAVGLVGQVWAQSSRHHRGDQGQSGTPGQFDYYLLTLSWAPEFCHSHNDSPECSGHHFGFVVHGLWPQFTSGGWPQDCSTAAGLADPSRITDIMPDPSLVAHEWTKHGTCSGLDADGYFALVRKAFESVHLPAKFSAPAQSFMLTPGEVKDAFVQANSQITADDMTVSCGNNYLTAVSVCMGKDLQPVTCRNLKDCRANKIKVPPVE